MSLRDRPDFQDWLLRFEERHARVHGAAVPSAGAPCEGCGEPLDTPASPSGYCLVCLAETFGRERGREVGRIAGMLESALERVTGAPPDDVRDAMEEVLERVERRGDKQER